MIDEQDDVIAAAFTTRLIVCISTEASFRLGRRDAHEEWEDQMIDTMRRYANELTTSWSSKAMEKRLGRTLKNMDSILST